MSLPSSLGPSCVGVRVVVRRVVHGQTGPSGGPAMTDVLGVMESWGDGVTVIHTPSGPVTIAIADIVSGKPVPPRPSVLARLSPELVERRALASWPADEEVEYGDWVLRASAGSSARNNSVLAVGSAQPLEPVLEFYASRELPAWAQVVVGSPLVRYFEDSGWVPARPGEADSLFQVASVARALRAARTLAPPPAPGIRGLVSVTNHGADIWAAIADVHVPEVARGQGQGYAVMAELLDRAAEQGAGTAYLQVRGDNPAALALYERLGFVTHHTYRYLTPNR